MFNVGGGEILLILLIALIVLGPDKLPSFARNTGKVMREVRRLAGGFQDEMRRAMEDDGPPPSSSPSPSAPTPAELESEAGPGSGEGDTLDPATSDHDRGSDGSGPPA